MNEWRPDARNVHLTIKRVQGLAAPAWRSEWYPAPAGSEGRPYQATARTRRPCHETARSVPIVWRKQWYPNGRH